MVNELKLNLDKIHTTPMGAERITRNLSLTYDPVLWCESEIGKATDIIRKGKNWYIRASGAVITVNANTYTIITAHKDKTTEYAKKDNK